MRGGSRQSSTGPAMLRSSQRLPAPPGAAAALPSAVFCCLPTEDAPAAPGPQPRPGHTRGAVTGPGTSHRCPSRGSCASHHGSQIAFPFLSYTAAIPAAIPRAAPTALEWPGPEWGLLLSCFPPGHGNEAPVGFSSTTVESPFLLQSGVHLLARPSAQVAKPVARPQLCPLCLRWPWPCTKAVRPHRAQAAPPSFALAGDRNSSGHSGLAAILGLEARHCGLQLRQSHRRSVGSQGWHQGVQWLLSIAVRGLGSREPPGVMGACRTPCSWQQSPPSPSSARTAPPWQPWRDSWPRAVATVSCIVQESGY